MVLNLDRYCRAREKMCPNDIDTFTMFRWTNSRNPARRVCIDLLWRDIGGNTLAFLDTRLVSDTYVTVGMRHIGTNQKQVHMSVFNPRIDGIPGEGFEFRRGKEKS